MLAAIKTKHKVWLQLIRSTESGCLPVTKQRACVLRAHLKTSAAIIYRYLQHGCLNQDDKRVDVIHLNDKAFKPPWCDPTVTRPKVAMPFSNQK
jgi:hypothetical protein